MFNEVPYIGFLRLCDSAHTAHTQKYEEHDEEIHKPRTLTVIHLGCHLRTLNAQRLLRFLRRSHRMRRCRYVPGGSCCNSDQLRRHDRVWLSERHISIVQHSSSPTTS